MVSRIMYYAYLTYITFKSVEWFGGLMSVNHMPLQLHALTLDTINYKVVRRSVGPPLINTNGGITVFAAFRANNPFLITMDKYMHIL